MKKLFLNSRAGFTLAELMAVVAIIAILAGIAIGSYRKAMDRAAFSEALQNMHMMSASADEYYEDHEHVRPTTLCVLNVGMSNSTAGSGCSDLKTKNFTYTITHTGTDDYINAASASRSGVSLRTYPEYGQQKLSNNELKQTECRGDDDFCQTLGFNTCDSSHVCVKY